MHKDEIEKAYWEALLNSPQGRWLIKQLINHSGCLMLPARDHSSKDSYYAGRREFVWERVVMQLMKHFNGLGVLDRVMKEN